MDRKITAEEWRQVLMLMPKVSRRLEEKKRELGSDMVRNAWHHGVVLGEPDRFFVAEGVLAIGAWPSDLTMLENYIDPATKRAFPGAFLVLVNGEAPNAR